VGGAIDSKFGTLNDGGGNTVKKNSPDDVVT
jgi:hypothetical protein